jgi:DNA-binding MarR family transcriptional regulator
MLIPLYQAALLQAKSYRYLRQDLSVLLKPLDLTMHEWVILSVLDQRKTQRTSDLADELGVELPMITQLTSFLEEKELIQRQKGEEDKRQRYFSLTTKGEELFQKSQDYLKLELEQYFAGISVDDMIGHLRVLHLIIHKHERDE